MRGSLRLAARSGCAGLDASVGDQDGPGRQFKSNRVRRQYGRCATTENAPGERFVAQHRPLAWDDHVVGHCGACHRLHRGESSRLSGNLHVHPLPNRRQPLTYATRAEILGNLGTALEAPVLAYVTGSRPNAETAISHDQIPLFPRHLEAIGKSERLALLIYTRGGDTNVPWPVVNFIREHCDRLIAVVPFYALSSGTLLTLGADEIQMSRYASLSPIDPTVANAFNPVDPANPGARVAIAVEDVLAYLELAEQTGGVGEKAAAFARLSESLHPLALGNVQRSINMIRQLARQLLALRGTSLGVDETEKLITRFTTEF